MADQRRPHPLAGRLSEWAEVDAGLRHGAARECDSLRRRLADSERDAELLYVALEEERKTS